MTMLSPMRGALALVGAVGALAAAEPVRADTPEVFTKALAAWAAKYKVHRAVIVVRRHGRLVHGAGLGGADPNTPVLLASLSKAITGACIATLVSDGRLSFETPLTKALAKFMKAHGRPADRRIERVTIAQLLTHRSGFAGVDDKDEAATGAKLDSYLSTHSPRDAPKPILLKGVLDAGLLRDPGTQASYSNSGYLLLGAIIEEATGQSYEDYCRAAVLTPNGAAGALDPAWRVLWSYGGWRMTGADYLKFYEVFDANSGKLGKIVVDWQLDQRGKAFGQPGTGSWYGLGVRLRETSGGLEIWHTGSWRRTRPPDAEGPLSVNTSTFAMRASDGTSWFVHSTPLVLGGARIELMEDLLRAHKAVARWP